MGSNPKNDTGMGEGGEAEQMADSTISWRKTSMDLKAHLLHLLDTGFLSDMTFLVDDGKESVPAHRFVLALWSKEFEEFSQIVEILTMTVSQVRSFLRYLYTEDFVVAEEDVITVLCIAKRFEIPALVEKCTSFLKSQINVLTALSMYNAAKLLNEETLADESLNFILKNGREIIQEDDFLSLTHENLCSLLERDDFEVDEIELFKAIYRWATNSVEKEDALQTPLNLRLVLKDAVKLIRYPLMNAKDFAVHVAPTEILKPEEMISLFRHFCIPAAERQITGAVDHGFVDRERKGGSEEPPKKRAKTLLASTSTDTEMTLVNIKQERNEDEEMADWRDPHAGLEANLITMLEHTHNCDVMFAVGENKEVILAHKFILGLWSGVYEGVWRHQNEDDKMVELRDYDATAFKSFLRALYGEKLNYESVDQVINIFSIAKHYEVGFLEEMCRVELKKVVADNTAITIFQDTQKLNDDSLADYCWSYILRRGFAVVKGSDFLNISYANLCTLLENDDLNVGETILFQNVLRWASHQCYKVGLPKNPESLRSVLRRAISLIRFPLMSPEDFSLHVAPTELLTDKKMVGVMVYTSLSPPERAKVNSLLRNKLAFSCKERKVKELLVKERTHLRDMTYFSLMCDCNVTIHGFSFSGIDPEKLGDAPTSLYFYNAKEGKNPGTGYTETTVVNEGNKKFSIRFQKPVHIKAGEWYTSSQMSVGRQGAFPVEKDSWITVKSSQIDAGFQFQVHPIEEVNGGLEYAIPEVICT